MDYTQSLAPAYLRSNYIKIKDRASALYDRNTIIQSFIDKVMNLKSKTALLTGAGSGIGRGIALALAKRGCNLALADINTASLAETAALLAAYNIKISLHTIDLTDGNAIKALPTVVFAEHSAIDILINNAGVAVNGSFLDVKEADFDWLMSINFTAVVAMTRTFLPFLKQQNEATIVNISSLFGIIAPPLQTAYSASKFAVRGFSNALRHELAATNVRVCVVHPGGIATNIAKNARFAAAFSQAEIDDSQARARRLLTMPPEKAGEIIVKQGIEHQKARILVGIDAKLLTFLEWLFPVSYFKIIGGLIRFKERHF